MANVGYHTITEPQAVVSWMNQQEKKCDRLSNFETWKCCPLWNVFLKALYRTDTKDLTLRTCLCQVNVGHSHRLCTKNKYQSVCFLASLLLQPQTSSCRLLLFNSCLICFGRGFVSSGQKKYIVLCLRQLQLFSPPLLLSATVGWRRSLEEDAGYSEC